MVEDIKEELQQITQAIRAEVDPVAIYLFGSYAYGTPHKDSDIDIFVVVPDSVTDTIDLNAKIQMGLFRKRVRAMDLLISRQSSFRRRKDNFYFEKKIYNQGVKLYGE